MAEEHSTRGMEIGTAVHEVLAKVSPGLSGEPLLKQLRELVELEGVADDDGVILAMARATAETDLFRRLASRPHWRAAPIWCPLPGGRLLNGVLDLVYRDEAGAWHIVDYKTDRAEGPDGRERLLQRYRNQLLAYADAFRRTTGHPVASASLLLCSEAAAGADRAAACLVGWEAEELEERLTQFAAELERRG